MWNFLGLNSGNSILSPVLTFRVGTIGFVLLCLLGFAVLFTRFSFEVHSVSGPVAVEQVDGLVVLTGDAHRIKQGIGLLKSGHARRLLISGVDQNTTRMSIARLINEEDAFKGCCIDIDRSAKNTVGNAFQSADWVSRNAFKSVILVTSDYHMPRSLFLMKREMPDIRIIPFATGKNMNSSLPLISNLFSPVFLREFMKYVSVRFGLEPTALHMRSALGYDQHT